MTLAISRASGPGFEKKAHHDVNEIVSMMDCVGLKGLQWMDGWLVRGG